MIVVDVTDNMVEAAAQSLYDAVVQSQADMGLILSRFLDVDLIMHMLPDHSPVARTWAAPGPVCDPAAFASTSPRVRLAPITVHNTESIYLLSLRARQLLLSGLDVELGRPESDLYPIIILMANLIDVQQVYRRYVMAVERRSEQRLSLIDLDQIGPFIQMRTGALDRDLILDRDLADLRHILNQHLCEDGSVDLLARAWTLFESLLDEIEARLPSLSRSRPRIYARLVRPLADFPDICFGRSDHVRAPSWLTSSSSSSRPNRAPGPGSGPR